MQPQLAAGQHRLDHVPGVHRAFGGSGTDDRVELVDEGDHLALRVGDLLEDGLEPLFELAPVLGPRHHRAEVQGQQPLSLQAVRDISGHDAVRQALHDRRLADARLTDQDRVVLGPPGENLDDPTDLLVATDDRIELSTRARPLSDPGRTSRAPGTAPPDSGW